MATDSHETQRTHMDSIAAVAAKAQHDPHCCWSLTGVTWPLVIQLTVVEAGADVGMVIVFDDAEAVAETVDGFMRYWLENAL